MAIEKGLYAAPTGLGTAGDAAGLEIEIVDPEAVMLSDGSMEITIVPDARSGLHGVRRQSCRGP